MSFLKNIFGENQENKPVSKVGWKLLTDAEQLNEIIAASAEKPVLVFKHSTRCHISKTALRKFENDFDLEEKIIPYFLDLIAYRTISDEIAVRFGVAHQSPQLIVIKNGVAVYNVSHEGIDADKLAQIV